MVGGVDKPCSMPACVIVDAMLTAPQQAAIFPEGATSPLSAVTEVCCQQ